MFNTTTAQWLPAHEELRLNYQEPLENWANRVMNYFMQQWEGFQAIVYLIQNPESKSNEHTLIPLAHTNPIHNTDANTQHFQSAVVSQAVRTRLPVLINEKHGFNPLISSAAFQARLRTLAAIPFVSGDWAEAVIEITSFRYFEPADFQNFSPLLFELAFQLQQRRNQNTFEKLYQETASKNKRLEQQEKELLRLNSSLEARAIEQEKNYNELKALQKQLIQSEKMASLGQLIAGIAHEINTPIGAIKASYTNINDLLPVVILNELPELARKLSPAQLNLFRQLLEKSFSAPRNLTSREERKCRQQLTKILTENHVSNPEDIAQRLVEVGITADIEPFLGLLQSSAAADIINTLYKAGQIKVNLDNISVATDKTRKVVFALKQYIHREPDDKPIPVNLAQNIDIILELYVSQFRYHVELDVEIDETIFILANPDEIGQIWTNLIVNALQAMSYNGKLTIRGIIDGDDVIIQITDNGPGIPEEVKSRIFEPFFTTRSRGEGTGLGLSLCQEIIQKYQGNIFFHSKPGETTFWVQLPLHQQ